MARNLINLGNHNQKSLHECDDRGAPERIQDDAPKPFCGENLTEEQKEGRAVDDFLKDAGRKKTGLGEQRNCDPMQTGQIVQDVRNPSRDVVYRYSKAIRGTDEAVQDLFRNMVVIDEDGKAHPVPITWATQEKAVAAILQDNVRKDNSLVVDRIRLPMLAVYSSTFQFNQSRYVYHKAVNYLRDATGKPSVYQSEKYHRDTVFGRANGIPVDIGYTLYAWTMYVEDMDQLLEQVFQKFSPVAYIRVRGVPQEVIVRLDSVANNIDVEPGDQNVRVIKFEFNLTAETYIPQPIVRKKAILKTRTNFFNRVETEEITETLCRLEEAVEELKQ